MTILLIVLAVTASIFIAATIFAIWVLVKVRKEAKAPGSSTHESR